MKRRAPTLRDAGRRRQRALEQARVALDDGVEILRQRLAAGEQVDVAAAARELQVTRATIYNRLPELGLRAKARGPSEPGR